jgi:hypothetical protein
MNMRAGQEVDVFCPATYSYGGDIKYSQFDEFESLSDKDLVFHF